MCEVESCLAMACSEMHRLQLCSNGRARAGIPCDDVQYNRTMDAAYRLHSATVQRYKAPLQTLLCAVLVYAKVRKEKDGHTFSKQMHQRTATGHRPRKDAKAARQGPRQGVRASIHDTSPAHLSLTSGGWINERFNSNP